MARTTSGRPRGNSRRSGTFARTSHRTGTVEFFTRPEQNTVLRVVGFLLRLRVEIVCSAVLVTVVLIGRDQIGPDATTITLIALTAVVLVIPASRRYAIRRVWCVITRHRMRSCFAKTRTMTHHGRMPFLWWSRPSPVGERVRVWLPAGMSVKDLERVTAELATACWARDTRITANRAQAALVVVDIVRRDPLASATPLTPTVIDGLEPDLDDEFDDDVVVPLPQRTDLPTPVPAQHADASGTRPTRTGKANGKPTDPAAAASNRSDPGVTGFGGVDVSDYV